MSIATTAYLMFGAPYSVWEQHLEDLDDLLSGGELDYACPRYDVDRDYWFVGFIVGRRGAKIENLETKIEECRYKISEYGLKILDECFLTVYPDVM